MFLFFVLIQATNDKFQATKVSNDFIARREQVLKQLDAGFNSFEEIRGNQKEGMKVNNEKPFLFLFFFFPFSSKIIDPRLPSTTQPTVLLGDGICGRHFQGEV